MPSSLLRGRTKRGEGERSHEKDALQTTNRLLLLPLSMRGKGTERGKDFLQKEKRSRSHLSLIRKKKKRKGEEKSAGKGRTRKQKSLGSHLFPKKKPRDSGRVSPFSLPLGRSAKKSPAKGKENHVSIVHLCGEGKRREGERKKKRWGEKTSH